jgi:predicted Fe-Mo cluster-binding NifX family protein
VETRSIAVAAEDDRGLDGRVAGHFGRCPSYVVVEAVGEEIRGARVVANPHVETHQPGQVPRFIQGLGVDAILAGGMGPRAVGMFSEFGIDVATGLTGSVRDVVAGYLRGEVSGTVPCGHDHPRSCGGGHHG